jgi:ubiquinone/menaquinone biosynthesis C-methylase UbiE
MSKHMIKKNISNISVGEYALATGPAAVRRLHVLHNIYAPAGRRVLQRAGVSQGMRVADFGCGVGVTTRMLAAIVGRSGSVTGIDADAGQIEQAREFCENSGLINTSFIATSAYNTGLPRNSFSAVYCRFLLLHLADPIACLREMRDLLIPGGILFIEDGDLKSATSIPPTALDAFADLFGKLGPIRGVDYSVANKLFHMVKEEGFCDIDMEIHQPALVRGENRVLLQWSVAEAGPAFVKTGIITDGRLRTTLRDMQTATEDPNVVVLAPRMSQVWARKPTS